MTVGGGKGVAGVDATHPQIWRTPKGSLGTPGNSCKPGAEGNGNLSFLVHVWL